MAPKKEESLVGYAYAMTFDSSGERLFVAWSVSERQRPQWTQIEEFDTSTWKLVKSWSVDDAWVHSLATSRNRKIIVGGTGTGGTEGGSAKLWDGATGRLLQTIRLYDWKVDEQNRRPNVYTVIVSPDGGLLAAYIGKDLFTYDISNPKRPRRMSKISGRIARIALSGDRDLLMSDLVLGVVRAPIAKPEDGEVVIDPDFLDGYYGLASAKDVILTRDESGVNAWRGGGQKPQVVAKELPFGKCLLVNLGATVAAGASHNVAYVWDLAGGREPKESEIRNLTFQNTVVSLALSPKGDLLAVSTYDPNDDDSPRVQVFEVKSGKEVAEFKFVDRRDSS